MKVIQLILIGFLLIFGLTQTGCASVNRRIKTFLGGHSDADAAKNKGLTKFSEDGEVPPRVRRQYKRVTRETLADENSLDPKAGSLWVMEGQGGYLFAENGVRLVGDPLPVTIEGDPKEQLESKVSVIKKLLAKIDERRMRARELASAEGDPDKASKAKDKKDKEKDKDKKDKTAKQDNAMPENSVSDTAGDFGVKMVPTRIIERTLEGNYRVKGMQPFLIGQREYKVIVTGVVRAEDYQENGISASKLLDPKFDIVSARRKEGEM